MHIKWLHLTLLLFTPSCFAFFCPNNFNQIDIGYSQDQVEAQCGKPDKQTTKDVKEEGPQEWVYYIPQTVLQTNNEPAQGTLKTSVVFDDKGKAINISVNGIGVGNSTICGTLIQLGDTRDAVKSACGKPSMINKQEGSEKKHSVSELTYANTVLVFENGQLKEKK